MKNKTIQIIESLLAILFIYAGIYKLLDISQFASQMYQSPLLPSSLIPFIAILLPLFEILLGILLIFSNHHYISLFTSFVLMLFFSVYLIMLFTLYAKPPCACGGILANMDYPVHIAFNIFFTLLSGIALFLHEKQPNSILNS